MLGATFLCGWLYPSGLRDQSMHAHLPFRTVIPLDMEMMFFVFSGPPSISAEQWLTYQVLGWLFSYGFPQPSLNLP